MILDSGKVDFSVSEGAELGICSRALCGTDFDNQIAFRLALAVLSISGSNYRPSWLRLPCINSKIP